MDRKEGTSAIESSELVRGISVVYPPLIVLEANGEYKFDSWRTSQGIDVRERERIIVDPDKYKIGLGIMYKNLHLGITEAIVEEGLPVRISLESRFPKDNFFSCGSVFSTIDESGGIEYQIEGVTEALPAIVLQQMISMVINRFEESGRKKPTIVGKPGGYAPYNLELPKKLVGISQPLTDKSYQINFVRRAKMIADKFGRKLWPEDNFTDNGLLHHVGLLGGSDLSYLLDTYTGRYGSHNVDTAEQAICLQWIVGTHIRDMAEIVATVQ